MELKTKLDTSLQQSEEEINRLQSKLMNKDDVIASMEHRMFTMQEEHAAMLMGLNARIRGYEDNLKSIVFQQEEKDQEFEDMY